MLPYICKASTLLGVQIDECKTAVESTAAFDQHIADFSLQFGTKAEYEFRREIFMAKDAAMKEINESQNSFKLGHNKFSTWSNEEYSRILGFKQRPDYGATFTKLDTSNLNDSVDWRAQGKVNDVKDQGRCGSCWAFSATGAVETAHAIASNELVSLSDQQVTSCSIGFGCGGGWQWAGFNYLKANAPELSSDYPYVSGTSQETGECLTDASKGLSFNVASHTNVPPNSVADLKAAIAQQAVSVTIEADNLVFQTYQSGVLDSTKCGTSLDHAVIAVGYGNENGQDYYIVRNSWGSSWGDAGYIKIAAVDGEGICGIQMQSSWPTVTA